MDMKGLSRLFAKTIHHGKLDSPQSSESFSLINPATGHELGKAHLCRENDIDRAVKDAEEAQKIWAKVKSFERGKILHACGVRLSEYKDELAHIMSLETGKALRTESKTELNVLADMFTYYAGLGLEIKGETVPFDPEVLVYTQYEPVGVVGAIIPWNVPLMLLACKICPALIAGNAVVVKPSPESTLVTLRACEIINDILPPGLLNVVTGDGETGALLVKHPGVRKVSFTGSVESGRRVYENAAKKLIPVTLELGGKSPFIIMDDADVEACVEIALEGMRFTRQGQSCSASSRIFVHESLHDVFLSKLKERLNTLVMGDPLDEKTDMGCLISKSQYEKVLGFIKLAEEDPTLDVHRCCELPKDEAFQQGYFVRPAIISNIHNDHDLCQKEIFGPVVVLIKWSNFEEVLKQANDVEFGLAAGIWTKDIQKALKAVNTFDAGFVQVNQYMVFRPGLPFGGFKNSGLGKEACKETILEHYMRKKTVMINLK